MNFSFREQIDSSAYSVIKISAPVPTLRQFLFFKLLKITLHLSKMTVLFFFLPLSIIGLNAIFFQEGILQERSRVSERNVSGILLFFWACLMPLYLIVVPGVFRESSVATSFNSKLVFSSFYLEKPALSPLMAPGVPHKPKVNGFSSSSLSTITYYGNMVVCRALRFFRQIENLLALSVVVSKIFWRRVYRASYWACKQSFNHFT